MPLIIGVLLIGAVGAFLALYRSSPGDLARAHAKVAGSHFIGDCNKCHSKQGLAQGCLDCHSEIASHLSKAKGLHGRLSKAKAQECGKCHSEHHGADFPLVNKVSWEGKEPGDYKHDPADYRLAGKHGSVACKDCHEKHAPRFSLPKYPKLRRARTFLGLGQECMSCHKDVHAAGLAWACVRCHDEKAWKPAPLFDHDKTYPLSLGHAKRECAKCHVVPAPGTPPPAPAPVLPAATTGYKGFPFDKVKGKRCVDCHKDPHRTKWVRGCEACHTKLAVPWAEGNKAVTPALHAVSSFRLQSPHHKAACKDCHAPALKPDQRYADLKTGKPRSEKACEACHADLHAGQFSPKHPRCMDCHQLAEFKPARYSAADHKTYVLQGKHAKAACNDCHVPDPKAGPPKRGKPIKRIYVPMRKDCVFCHADIHLGQFRKRAKGSAEALTRCEDCHLDHGAWKTLVFDHDKQSRFKLDAAHVKVACKDCHPVVSLPDRRRLVQYKPVGVKCTDCHELSTP
ncbi:MAG: hypothetical protein HY924_09905 [Elusimicrobia bacterium]|nr:hypothetical protein [Elusimicrobiota bacterium]